MKNESFEIEVDCGNCGETNKFEIELLINDDEVLLVGVNNE